MTWAETDNVEEPFFKTNEGQNNGEGTPPILTMHTYLSPWTRAAPMRPAPACGIAAGVPFLVACVFWVGERWKEAMGSEEGEGGKEGLAGLDLFAR